MLALMGDSIDNIKGVPGIGEKGARDLIAKYGTLEELLAHAAEVPNKRYREGLLNHADDARQSRELARIRIDVPVDVRSGRDALPRRRRASDASSCSRGSASASLVMEFAPTAETVGKDYASCDTLDGRARRWSPSCAAARPLRASRAAGRSGRDAGGNRRAVVLDVAARRRATCRSRRERPVAALRVAATTRTGMASELATRSQR